MTNNVRRGATQAKVNESGFKLVNLSMFIASVAAGFYMQSWFYFGGVFLGLIFAYQVPQFRTAINLSLIIGWAALGYIIGSTFFTENAAYVLTVFGALVGLGASVQSGEFVDDMNADRSKERE